MLSGQLLLHCQYDELYQVAVQPLKDATSVYPNRPASPGLKERRANAAAAATKSAAAASSTAGPAAYVPPHLRGRLGDEAVNVVSAMIADDRGRQSHKKLSQPATSHANISNKSKARNTANKPTQASDAAGSQSTRSGKGSEEKKEEEATVTASSASASAQPSSAADESVLSAELCEKRLRAAAKKKRQIGELRERQEKGQQLDQGQEDKIRTAGEVDAEVERLRQRLEVLRSGS